MTTPTPEEQKQTIMGAVPNTTADVDEFPSVKPHVASKNYQYTLIDGDNDFLITSDARSVKELFQLLFPSPGVISTIERVGDVAFFPEACVRVVTGKGAPRFDIVAGWLFSDEDEDPDEEDEPDEPEPEKPARRKPKWANGRG